MDFQKYASIEAAFKAAKETGSLNIVNTSDLKGKQSRGRLILSVMTEDTQNITITIPPTWIPFNLVEWATLEALTKSTSVRSYFRKGLLAFIPENAAAEIRKSPKYAAEHAKYQNLVGVPPVEEEFESFTLDTGSKVSVKAPKVEAAAVAGPIAAEMIRMHFDHAANNIDFSTLHDYVRDNLASLSKPQWEYITGEINDRQSFLFQVASNAVGAIDVGDTLELTNFPFYESYVEDMV